MASVLSQEQIQAFLNHIGIGHIWTTDTPGINTSHEFLTALQTHTISTLPYENLAIHYNPAHKVSIGPLDAYEKIVERGMGRGGYCMENSILLHHVLRGLGFKVYMAGVRIRLRENGVPAGAYIGWVHIVNIVTLSNDSKYALDVGFGGDGPTLPLPLIDGLVHTNLGTQEIRLVHDWIPSQTLRTEQSKLWIYQYRNAVDKEWNAFYAFAESEFMEPDFAIMNWFTGHSLDSHQTHNIIIVAFLREEGELSKERPAKIVGKRTLLNGLVKELRDGKTKVVFEAKDEKERVWALREYFGIELTGEERRAIEGWRCELLRRKGEDGYEKGETREAVEAGSVGTGKSDVGKEKEVWSVDVNETSKLGSHVQ